RLGHIPAEGEWVDFKGRRFKVVKMEAQRIAQVRVDPIADPEAPEAPAGPQAGARGAGRTASGGSKHSSPTLQEPAARGRKG
ncbi:MAG: transporter associated domain-containing protein, partial [Acidobacteriota bacterium]